MGSDQGEWERQVEQLLTPMMDRAVEQFRVGMVDGVRLGIGMCATTVDYFIDRAPTLTDPDHVDAVVTVLRAVAAVMREQSARFTLDQ